MGMLIKLEYRHGFRGQLSRPERPEDIAGNMIVWCRVKVRRRSGHIDAIKIAGLAYKGT